MEWFVSKQGLKEGPFTTVDVVRKVVSGDYDERSLVWREGLPSWQPLTIHFKKPKTFVVAQTEIAHPTVSKASVVTTFQQRNAPIDRNIVQRFWRGNYSLSVSFGLVSILGSGILLVLYGVLGLAFHDFEYNPYTVISAIGLSWLLAVAWTTFQFIGTWRSAQNHRQVQTKKGLIGPAIVIQGILCIGTACLGLSFLFIGLPQLGESWRIAFQNDPGIPAYSLRLMRNGTELEVAGGFKFGLADDVEKILRASPQVKIMHLNSDGGRIGEATKLAKLIRSRKLTTYTSARCLSACTIAFAAGQERWILAEAKLGYHAGSFAGQNIADAMRDVMMREGFEVSFVEKAVSYPANSMWYPTVAELSKAKVVNGVVDSYKFAASGYGVKPGSEDFAVQLRKLSIYVALERTNPSLFNQVAREFQQKYVDGFPEGVIIETMRGKIVPYIQQRLDRADDKTLVEYADLIADQYESLGKVDAKICYEYAVIGATTDISKLLSSELRRRELALSERVLLATQIRRPIPTTQIEGFYDNVFDKLSKQYTRTQLALLSETNIRPNQHALYCRLATSMFREIARLAPAEAGAIMSALFKEANQTSDTTPAAKPQNTGQGRSNTKR